MPTRQTIWPRQWLMTDERMGDELWAAVARLPEGAGVLFRHYASQRANLARDFARACEQRGLMLAVARDPALARALGAKLVHNPDGDPNGLAVSRSVHSLGQAEAARATGAALVFVSPVYATTSHPGAAPLGLENALALANVSRAAGIALGGMDRERGMEAIAAGFHGWAAIDAWLRD